MCSRVILLMTVFPFLFFSTELNMKDIIVEKNMTAILGDETYLRCLYIGNVSILYSSWNRLDSSSSLKRVAGCKYNGLLYNNLNASNLPASSSNLTFKVNIDNLNMEGQYTCVFNTDEAEIRKMMFLSVLGKSSRPSLNHQDFNSVHDFKFNPNLKSSSVLLLRDTKYVRCTRN